MRTLVVLVLDSLRYDVAVEAEMTTLTSLGPLERRHSYATWTAPSHNAFGMGLLPYVDVRYRLAADEYLDNYRRFGARLGVEIDLEGMLPAMNLAAMLREKFGYRTEAYVSMPVLNEASSFSAGFDHYELVKPHNDLDTMIDMPDWDDGRPRYVFFNSGITHYPYTVPGAAAADVPYLAGVHGVLAGRGDGAGFPGRDQARLLRERQVVAARHADRCVARLLELMPPDSWLVVTSDHGELFGEDGYFGHGPMPHPLLLEVPFVEGPVP